MLLNPDPADWPNWRRTLDGWGYSPLKQITTQNVHQLQLAWSWGLSPGLSQPTPLVANGMMYVPSPGGGVQALDAANGDLLWEYKNTPPDGGAARTSPMRNLAIYGDKVYVATADARLVALNARTGAVAWDHQVADTKLGYTLLQRPDRREGHDRGRHHRLSAIQERRLLHLGARCANRQGAVADVDDRAARANRAATPGAICR